MGLVILLIVSLGIFGNLKNILRRRKKEIAIRMALGERNGYMLGEFIAEFEVVFSLGTVMGCLCGEIFRNIYAFDSMFEVGFAVYTLLISFVWVLIMITICAVVVFVRIRKNLPGIILTEQE